MNAVDTNVFIYALDADEPVKQAKAPALGCYRPTSTFIIALVYRIGIACYWLPARRPG